jgi:NADH:ubiquinone oxidoreductase subunit
MDRGTGRTYMSAMTTIGTRLFTWLHGREVGRDAAGNVYYEEKRPAPHMRPRRWVIYAGPAEASRVPPEWHAWLHYTTEAPIAMARKVPWLKPHTPNLTGTPLGYRPPGHDYRGGHRPRATGDYEAWTPDAAAGA